MIVDSSALRRYGDTPHRLRGSAGSITGLRGTVQDITERKHAEEALSNANGRLIEAQEAERARAARDLHDDIGQRLALRALTMAPLEALLPESSHGEARVSLDAFPKQLAEIITDVQALSHQLHPPRLLYLGLEDDGTVDREIRLARVETLRAAVAATASSRSLLNSRITALASLKALSERRLVLPIIV